MAAIASPTARRRHALALTTAALALALGVAGCAPASQDADGARATTAAAASTSRSAADMSVTGAAPSAGRAGASSTTRALAAAATSVAREAELASLRNDRALVLTPAGVVVGADDADNTAEPIPDRWEPDLSVVAFEGGDRPTGLFEVLSAGEDSPVVDEAVEELAGGITGTGEDGREGSSGTPNDVRAQRVYLVCEDPEAGTSSIGYRDPTTDRYVPVAWSERCGGFSARIPASAEGETDTVVTVDVPVGVRYSIAEIRSR